MKIYCSGIGGIGLSAYAALQNAAGHTVYGSDRSDSPLLEDLRSQGITIFLEQDGTHLPDDLDLFVYSEAIPADAPERKRAAELEVEQKSYFQALGAMSKNSTVIAVCGTHGKSSTTSMAAKVLVDAGIDPTVVVGTKVPDLDGRNWRKGASNVFLLEACEYRRSFHYLSPDIILMTNTDGDHFDYYKDEADFQQAFVDFLKLLPPDGVVISHLSDKDNVHVIEESGAQSIDADSQPLVSLKTPGKHMQENAQLVLALADELNIEKEVVEAALADYKGCWRRLEHKGDGPHGVPVYDDYGHHPREIKPTIAALQKKYKKRRFVCVFQPHMHDRTLKLYDEFVHSFDKTDVVIIPYVFDARSDVEREHVDVDKLVADIAAASGAEVLNGESLEKTEQLLREEILQQGDLLLCVGAGDVTKLASRLVV